MLCSQANHPSFGGGGGAEGLQPLRIIRPETLATQATMGMKKEEVAD